MDVRAFTPRYCPGCKSSHVHEPRDGVLVCRACGHVDGPHDHPDYDGPTS